MTDRESLGVLSVLGALVLFYLLASGEGWGFSLVYAVSEFLGYGIFVAIVAVILSIGILFAIGASLLISAWKGK